MNKKKLLFWDILPWLIIGIGLFALSRVNIPDTFQIYFQYLSAWRQNNPYLFIIFFLGMHFLSSQLCIPGGCTILNISAGAFWGLSRAVIMLFPITLLSLFVGYWIGTKLKKLNFEKIELWQKKIQNMQFKRTQLSWLIALRLSPILPFNILNITLGAMQISFKNYFISGFIGISTDVLVLSSLGHIYRNHNALSFWDLFLLVLIVIGFFLFSFKFIRPETQIEK